MFLKIMDRIKLSALVLAKSADNCPFISTLTVILYYIMFSVFEAGIEKLIFGDYFHHWLDPIFQIIFILYAALVVWMCALNRIKNET